MTSPAPLLHVLDVSFRYPPPQAILALDRVTLTVHPGEFVAVIGRNGSGKSTLVKQMVRLLGPTSGIIRFAGQDLRRLTRFEIARAIGYVYQNPDRQLFQDLVWDEVTSGPRNLGLARSAVEQRGEEALRFLDLVPVRSRNVFTLSRGQRQRVAIAAVLAMQPRVVIIDEPTTGQDVREARTIMDILQRLNAGGTTVLVITHDMSLVAEYVGRTVALAGGRIIADGPTREVFARPELLETTSVRPPQITRLTLALSLGCALRVDEAVAMVTRRMAAQGEGGSPG